MRRQIDHVSIHQTSKFLAILKAILMTLFGIIPYLIYHYRWDDISGLEFLIGLIGLPILFGILFYLLNAFLFWLYNCLAKKIGGIEVDVKDVDPAAVPIKDTLINDHKDKGLL